jgi:hypothetical protein
VELACLAGSGTRVRLVGHFRAGGRDCGGTRKERSQGISTLDRRSTRRNHARVGATGMLTNSRNNNAKT